MKSFIAGLIVFTLAMPILAEKTAPANRLQEFQTFWTGFREALLADNGQEKVVSMTNFPFRTRGPMDSDPVVKHNRSDFPKLLNDLLMQDPGVSAEPTTMRALIKGLPAVTGKDLAASGNEARVSNFKFERLHGIWRFTMAYRSE